MLRVSLKTARQRQWGMLAGAVGLLLMAGFALGQNDSRPPASSSALGCPGYLIISAGRDSTVGYHWLTGPGVGQKSLVWANGQFIMPDSLDLEPFGVMDLGITTEPSLQGSGGGGVLEFRDGRFAIDQPLLLTDGRISLYAADGELEIRGAQIRYNPPDFPPAKPSGKTADPRAGFLFLAGIVVLIVVLMRRARLQTRATK